MVYKIERILHGFVLESDLLHDELFEKAALFWGRKREM